MINTMGRPPSSRHLLRHLAGLWLLAELELGRTEVESIWGACAWGSEAYVMSVRDKDSAFIGCFALSTACDRLCVHFCGWCHRPDEQLRTRSQMPPEMVLEKKTWSQQRWDGELVRLSASAFVHERLEMRLTERWSTRQDTSESTAQSRWLHLIYWQDSQTLESWQDLIAAMTSVGWPMGRKKPIDGPF